MRARRPRNGVSNVLQGLRMPEKKSYCAFIDLLGTKESANVHAASYSKGIEAFTNLVTATALELADNSHVYIFSDCAFVAFKDFASFARYIASVRYQLFSDRFFFKCAVVPGELTANTWAPTGVQRQDSARLVQLVSGTTFGDRSVAAFSLQEAFKGIGIIIDPSVGQSKYTVETIFFKDDDLRTISVGHDLRYSKQEIGDICSGNENEKNGNIQSNPESFIRTILSSVVSAKTKQRKYGRYYISMLVSLVKSSDFSKVEYDKSSGRWKKYPIIFRHLFVNNFIEKSLSDVLGWEYCYLAAIGEYFKQQTKKREDTFEAIIRELAKRPRVARKLSGAPRSLIAGETKDQLLREIAALATNRLIPGKGSN